MPDELTHVTQLDTDELNTLVRNNDPRVKKFFGAKLAESPYFLAVRTKEEEKTHNRIVSAWPRFKIQGSGWKAPADGKAWLWKVVEAQLGEPFLVHDQKTGSCVGQGFAQGMHYLQAVEAWQNGESEEVLVPYFWLWNYGISRWIIEPNGGQGEGSFGSAIAEAGAKYGMFAYKGMDSHNLPKWDDQGGNGRTWGEREEMRHSHINPNSEKWRHMREAGASHLMKTSALLKSADEVRDAICNGYPVTTASNWGGKMQCPIKYQGTPDAYLRNDRSDTWPHQMVLIGWWDHPKDGELFYCKNSWSKRAHGVCPTGAPVGGFWMPKKDVQGIANERYGELIAYSQYEGYKAQQLDWGDIYRKLSGKFPVHSLPEKCP